MASSRMAREWARRIESGTFTHAQCRAFAKTVIAMAEDGALYYAKTSLTQAEARELVRELRRRGGVNLTDDHTAKGLAWIGLDVDKVPTSLRSYYATLRKGRNRDAFPEWVREEFSRFSFDGYAHRLRNGLGEVAHRVPVWRIHGARGQTLDYYAVPWQSGAESFAIVRESTAPETVAYDPTPRELELASEYYAGQGSALYAIASTGKLSLGSIRPYGDDGPMTNDEWLEHLRGKLRREIAENVAVLERADVGSDEYDAAQDDYDAFRAWSNKL